MRIAFDLDGVIADIDIFQLRSADFEERPKIKKELNKWYYSTRRVQLRPILFRYVDDSDEIYIITSRHADLEEITKKWLKANNIYYDKLIFVHHKPENIIGLEDWFKRQARKKADILIENNIDVYFEDTPSTVKYLREFCPNNIKIIQYGDRIA